MAKSTPLNKGRTTGDNASTVDKSGRITMGSHQLQHSCHLCLLSPRNSIGGDIAMRPFGCYWVSEWVCVSVLRALPCGHNTDFSFCPITFKLRGQRSRSTLALCV